MSAGVFQYLHPLRSVPIRATVVPSYPSGHHTFARLLLSRHVFLQGRH